MDITGAIIGLGDTAESDHLPAYTQHPAVDLKAICDIDQDRLTEIGDKYKIPKRYSNSKEVFENENIDIVSICTPPKSHYDIACSAVREVQALLVEKPTVLSLGEAQDLCSKIERRNIVGGSGYKLQFAPTFDRSINQIKNNIIGPVEEIKAYFYGDIPDKEWKLSLDKSGGGVFLQLFPHVFSYILRISEGEFVIKDATVNRTGVSEIETDAKIEGEINDIKFSISAGWRPYNGPNGFYIFGKEGTISLDLAELTLKTNNQKLRYSESGLPWVDIPHLLTKYSNYRGKPYNVNRVYEFIDVVVNGGQYSAPISDSIKILSAIKKAYDITEAETLLHNP